MVRILFLGGAKRVSVARHFIEYGRSIGHDVKIYSYELDDCVPISDVGEVIVGLKWSDPDLFSHLSQVISDRDISMVFPFVDRSIPVTLQLKGAFPELFVPLSSDEVCSIMLDKISSARWFSENGIVQPRCYSSLEEVEYPVILKPTKGFASQGIIVADSVEHLPPQGNIFEEYLVQEYFAQRTEYSVDCYVGSGGEVLSVVPRIRLETAGGEAIKSVVVRHEKIIEQCKEILNKGAFRGPITLQFIGSGDKLYIMEINPRLGGAVVASIGAGSGLMSLIFNDFYGIDSHEITNWREGTIMTRYFQEVIHQCN